MDLPILQAAPQPLDEDRLYQSITTTRFKLDVSNPTLISVMRTVRPAGVGQRQSLAYSIRGGRPPQRAMWVKMLSRHETMPNKLQYRSLWMSRLFVSWELRECR